MKRTILRTSGSFQVVRTEEAEFRCVMKKARKTRLKSKTVTVNVAIPPASVVFRMEKVGRKWIQKEPIGIVRS